MPAGKIIQPADAKVGNIQFQPLAYAHPEQCPLGLEMVITRPGELAPLAGFLVPKGAMLVAIPPEVAQHVYAQMKALVEAQKLQTPGQVKAPGFD